MNAKLTQRPEFVDGDWRALFWDARAANYVGVSEKFRALQAYIETLEAKLRTEQAMSSMEQDAQMLADKLTQREGWLTREEVDRLDEIMASFEWDEDDYALIKSLTEGPHYEKLGKLCRMALYALNGPPAVDLDKVRELLKKVAEAGYYETSYTKGLIREALALLPPPAPTDHKEQL